MSEYGEHFIREIEIRNYKLFKDFKAEGFGRVNLIGGKNNVGKTAFMEACYLSRSENTGELFASLLEIETHRDLINRLLLKSDRKDDLRTLIKKYMKIEIFVKGKGGYDNDEVNREYTEWEDGLIKINMDNKINIYTKYTKINIGPIPLRLANGDEIYPSEPEGYSLSDLVDALDTYLFSTKYSFSLNLISPYSNSNKELENIIGEAKLNEKYEILNNHLNNIFKIKKIDIIKNEPLINVSDEWIKLSEFGQGLKSFINLVGSILLLENDIIFIDEIENGIHYTNLDKLWEIILTISKEQNVQVFATTHSKECIESYARVAKKLEDEEIGFIQLGRNKKNELDSIVMNSERFQRFIELGNEVRGW